MPVFISKLAIARMLHSGISGLGICTYFVIRNFRNKGMRPDTSTAGISAVRRYLEVGERKAKDGILELVQNRAIYAHKSYKDRSIDSLEAIMGNPELWDCEDPVIFDDAASRIHTRRFHQKEARWEATDLLDQIMMPDLLFQKYKGHTRLHYLQRLQNGLPAKLFLLLHLKYKPNLRFSMVDGLFHGMVPDLLGQVGHFSLWATELSIPHSFPSRSWNRLLGGDATNEYSDSDIKQALISLKHLNLVKEVIAVADIGGDQKRWLYDLDIKGSRKDRVAKDIMNLLADLGVQVGTRDKRLYDSYGVIAPSRTRIGVIRGYRPVMGASETEMEEIAHVPDVQRWVETVREFYAGGKPL